MKETSNKSRGLIAALAASASLGGVSLPMGELASALRKNEISLYLPVKNMPDIDIAHTTPQEATILDFMLWREQTYPNIPPEKVIVVTNGDREACQIYLTMDQIYTLSKIGAKETSVVVPRKENLAAARSVCGENHMVPGSANAQVLGGGPYSVVVPEGRVAMQPLVVEPKLIVKR